MLYVIMFLASSAFASDGWLCQEDSTQIREDQILACGVGEAETESAARKNAIVNAREEFNSVCDEGSPCALYQHTAEPKRATCEELGNGYWKCYRLVVYRVTRDKRVSVEEKPQAVHNSYTVNRYSNLSNQELMDNAMARTFGVWR